MRRVRWGKSYNTASLIFIIPLSVLLLMLRFVRAVRRPRLRRGRLWRGRLEGWLLQVCVVA